MCVCSVFSGIRHLERMSSGAAGQRTGGLSAALNQHRRNSPAVHQPMVTLVCAHGLLALVLDVLALVVILLLLLLLVSTLDLSLLVIAFCGVSYFEFC